MQRSRDRDRVTHSPSTRSRNCSLLYVPRYEATIGPAWSPKDAARCAWSSVPTSCGNSTSVGGAGKSSDDPVVALASTESRCRGRGARKPGEVTRPERSEHVSMFCGAGSDLDTECDGKDLSQRI